VLKGLLADYRPIGPVEIADVERMRELVGTVPDPWSRTRLPLHFTSSALIVHPPSGRLLLRWHAKQERWLGVGGHGDPGETDPLLIALREAREESGLTDVAPWPDGSLVHAMVCQVRRSAAEPAHEHADLRYLLATDDPEAIAAEDEQSPLRWVSVAEAHALLGADNLALTLGRVARLLTSS
jgi:8-oxo-dGTP pyrophosphatase MutT (NUDIX family)